MKKRETLASEKNVQSLETDKIVIQTSSVTTFSSFFLPVEINKVKIDFLIDTGSPVTLISEKIIENLGIGSSGLSGVASTLSTADGNNMKVLGQIKCKMKIGTKFFDHELIVTQLGKLKGIIGMDFLQKFMTGLAIIH